MMNNTTLSASLADTRQTPARVADGLKLPLVCVTPFGTISIMLAHHMNVELSIDRSLRVVCWDKFAVSSNQKGTKSGILHPFGHIMQEDDKVYCYYRPGHENGLRSGNVLSSLGMNATTNSNKNPCTSSPAAATEFRAPSKLFTPPFNDLTNAAESPNSNNTDPKISKMAILGTQGVLFSMSHLKDAFLVSAIAARGTSALSMDRIQFPSLRYDYTLRHFYADSQMGPEHLFACNNIVQRARYEEKKGMLFSLSINGFLIRQRENGDVEIFCRPRQIVCSPTMNTVHLRTASVEMEVQTDEKSYVKCGAKRVHVSKSGMVVSDGNCTTSMDTVGRILSAS